MFNTNFNQLAVNKTDYKAKNNKDLETFLNEDINMGVYKVGFVKTQQEYETACRQLFRSLGKLEQLLSKKKFVCGPQLTLLDIRLFETLIRFDLVYSTIFKCNHKTLTSYMAIAHYVRMLYSGPYHLGEFVHEEHIKRHYFLSYPKLNPGGIVPIGPEPWWRSPPVIYEPEQKNEVQDSAPMGRQRLELERVELMGPVPRKQNKAKSQR